MRRLRRGRTYTPTTSRSLFRAIPRSIGAHYGSLDAALQLHNAVLPGWHWSLYDTDGLGKPHAQVEPPEFSFEPIMASADNPARAWLLAILKALIEEDNSSQ